MAPAEDVVFRFGFGLEVVLFCRVVAKELLLVPGEGGGAAVEPVAEPVVFCGAVSADVLLVLTPEGDAVFGLGLGAVPFCGLLGREVLLVGLRCGGGVVSLVVLLEKGAVAFDGGGIPALGGGGEEVEVKLLGGDGGVEVDCELGRRGVVVLPVP